MPCSYVDKKNGGERKKFFKSNVTVVKSEKSTSDPKGYINWAKGTVPF